MKPKSDKLIYTPSISAILADLLLLAVAVLIVLLVTPFSSEIPFQKYFDFTFFYFACWFITSYSFKRYTLDRTNSYMTNIFKLIWTILTVQVILSALFLTPLNTSYSIWIIVGYSLLIFSLGSIFYIIQFTISNAVEYKDIIQLEKDKPDDTKIVTKKRDKRSSQILIDSIIEFSGEKVYAFISKFIDFNLKNNLVSFSSNYFDIKSKPEKKFTGIVILNKLNNIRGINKLFSIVNHKLPMEGTFVCSFEQRSTRKKRIYDKYPKGLNHIVYFIDYLTKRVIPKFFVMDKLYYNITQGKNRILSKTEVLGRLVYCGFDIVETKKLNGITYVIAKKIKNLDAILESKRYGPLLTLRRLGKNGKVFNVFKFRTMYSYAEYLQAYIYRTSKLQKGGKFNKDIRVNTMGKFMRKYWIDELPMFINVLRGEMKLVGVRPLSQHYYSLYAPELQKMRIRYKPGLLPPFYADLPETLEEIQESEFRYLQRCEKNGIFVTDMKYLVKILNNILIKRVKSA
ncbi:MAG: sugar transferase [Bacteroidaceae bacterium]|nr:sugar transferase [Bacteroidaceae bacterium]